MIFRMLTKPSMVVFSTTFVSSPGPATCCLKAKVAVLHRKSSVLKVAERVSMPSSPTLYRPSLGLATNDCILKSEAEWIAS